MDGILTLTPPKLIKEEIEGIAPPRFLCFDF